MKKIILFLLSLTMMTTIANASCDDELYYNQMEVGHGYIEKARNANDTRDNRLYYAHQAADAYIKSLRLCYEGNQELIEFLDKVIKYRPLQTNINTDQEIQNLYQMIIQGI